MPTVALVTKDPVPDGDAPGPSFTRFVLPFAYSPHPYVGDDPGALYEPLAPNHEADRHHYLTPETADTLFNRALWLELYDPAFATTREHGFVDVGAPPHAEPTARLALHHAKPRLVLFEWAAHSGRAAAAGADDDDRGPNDLLSTGFLILDVAFAGVDSVDPTLTHLQQLNEFFRWWQRPYKGYGARGYTQFFGSAATDDSHACYFDRWAKHLTHPFRAAQGGPLWQLFPPDWETEARRYAVTVDGPQPGTRPRSAANADDISAGDTVGEHNSGWIVYPDPRAFVWTCACAPGGAGDLSHKRLHRDALPADWIRLLNVDAPGTGNASDFERRWARKRTYDRWLHAGTLYGVCAHAGAVIAPPRADPPIHHHFAEMYFDQTLLLLYLRVSTFRFSRELSAMSSRARASGPRWREPLAEDFQELRGSFALLTNLYRFPLLSHQQQGIELYALARKHFDIEELFQEIQSEVHATDEFLSGATQLDHATMATLLTVVASLALGIALGIDFLQVPPTARLFDVNRWVTVAMACGLFFGLLFFVLLFAQGLGRWLRSVAHSLHSIRRCILRHAARRSHAR